MDPAATYPYNPGYADSNPIDLSLGSLVITPIQAMLADCARFIPELLAAIYIIIFGWIIGRLLQWSVSKFLEALRFDVLADKIGLKDFLSEGAKPITPSRWFGVLIFWLSILTSIILALGRVRLSIAADQLSQALYLLTASLSAIVILPLGMFLSEFVARWVFITGQKLEVPHVGWISNITRFAVLFMTMILVLNQFRIPHYFILAIIAAVFVTVCLTIVLAFGVGGRQWAAKILDKIK